MSVKEYILPNSLEECLGCLTDYRGEACLIGGGTDLMPKLESGRIAPRALVDTSRIEGLDQIAVKEDGIYIGGTVTHAAVSKSPEMKRLLPALAKACGSVGSPQIRNVATLAGNVINAQPAADGAIALVALGAEAEIAAPGKLLRQPVEELYRGVGSSTVDASQEVLKGFVLPAPKAGQSSAFGRIAPRNALCLPTANVAAFISSSGGKITEARIAMGPVSEKPFRPNEAEQSLVGAGLDDRDAFLKAAELAARASSPRSSCFRGCSDYRRQLIRILCGRVVAEAALNAHDRRLGRPAGRR